MSDTPYTDSIFERMLAAKLTDLQAFAQLRTELERLEKYARALTGAAEQAVGDDSLGAWESERLLTDALAERPANFPEIWTERRR